MLVPKIIFCKGVQAYLITWARDWSARSPFLVSSVGKRFWPCVARLIVNNSTYILQ